MKVIKWAAKRAPQNEFPAFPAIPGFCTGFVNRVSDIFWENRLGIETTGNREITHSDAQPYQSLPYYVYRRILKRLNPGPHDVLADLGSGKGRLVCVAATHRVKEVVGIEIDPELSLLARANVAGMRLRRAPVRLLCGSAADFDFKGITKILIFNPFGAATITRMLSRLKTSIEAQPRTIRIVYLNPVHAGLLSAESWLELHEIWQPESWDRIKCPVHFYRTR